MAEGKGHAQKDQSSMSLSYASYARNTLNKEVMKVSSDNPESVDSTRQLRLKLQSDTFRDATDRLTVKLQADSPQLFAWHKDCKSNYMCKYKIDILTVPGQKGMTGQIL